MIECTFSLNSFLNIITRLETNGNEILEKTNFVEVGIKSNNFIAPMNIVSRPLTSMNLDYISETLSSEIITKDDSKKVASKMNSFKTVNRKRKANLHTTTYFNEYHQTKRRRKNVSEYPENLELNSTVNFVYSELELKKSFSEYPENFVKELKGKLDHFQEMTLGITEIDNIRCYVCTICNYVSHHFMRDVIKHMIVKHCNIDSSIFNICSKFISKVKEINNEINETKKKHDTSLNDSSENGTIYRNYYKVHEEISDIDKLFYIDYDCKKFKKHFRNRDSNFISNLSKKMNKIKNYTIGNTVISGVRYFVCMECFYKTNHNMRDVKNHVLAVHCSIERSLIPDVIKVSKTAVQNDIIMTVVEQIQKDDLEKEKYNVKNEIETVDKAIINCNKSYKKRRRTYEKNFEVNSTMTFIISDSSFQDIFRNKSSTFRKDLKAKIDTFINITVGRAIIEEHHCYVCMECNYYTKHQLRDMKKHIMLIHCNIDFSLFNLCCQVIKAQNSQ